MDRNLRTWKSGLCPSLKAKFWLEITLMLKQRDFLRISVTMNDQLNIVYYRVYWIYMPV
jgi:hypothetical protein